jgi:signal transduction histidine kinase
MVLRLPRIKSGHFSAPFEQLTVQWTIRLGVCVAAVALVYALILLFGEFYLLLFATVLLASIFGGLVPGLLVLATIISFELFSGRISMDETRRLLVEGTLVSVGVSLRTARFKARERREAELKMEQQILKMEEDERSRIGRDLHDGLGQHLTGISLLSETVAQQLAAGGKPDPVNVEAITRLVSEAIRITRDLGKSLSPITLELEGLQAAVEELADTSSSLLGIRCTCEGRQQDLLLDRTRSLHIFVSCRKR